MAAVRLRDHGHLHSRSWSHSRWIRTVGRGRSGTAARQHKDCTCCDQLRRLKKFASQSSGRSSENFGGARLGKRMSSDGVRMAASVAAVRTIDEVETENGVLAPAAIGGVGELAGLSRRS